MFWDLQESLAWTAKRGFLASHWQEFESESEEGENRRKLAWLRGWCGDGESEGSQGELALLPAQGQDSRRGQA